MKSGFTHESQNAETVSWYTPPSIFELLNLEFDIDVCSPKGGVPWIPAKRHYSIEDDGLTSPWIGKIWCNPPYGKETPRWLKKMNEHRNGIALVFARTDTKWFHDYAVNADALLFLKGRVQFVDGLNLTSNSGSTCGSVLLGYGEECIQALNLAKDKGLFVKRQVKSSIKVVY